MKHRNRLTGPATRPRPAIRRRGGLLLPGVLMVVAGVALGGCQQEYQETELPLDEPRETTAPAGPSQPWEALADTLAEAIVDMPADSAATDLLVYLEAVEYRERWNLWPERGRFYEGTEPHGMLLTTYVNDRGRAALLRLLQGEEDHLPLGSVVVKENFRRDSSLAAVTVMFKAGRTYDPEHHDWFWLKYAPPSEGQGLPAAEVQAAGRASGCISCHGDAGEGHDFLMTAGADAGGAGGP